MPSWNELLDKFNKQPSDDARATWLDDQIRSSLEGISQRRGGTNVLFYASAFLQKPHVPDPWLLITHEDINGFMSAIFGMDWSKGLTLILHTPGGLPTAAETIVAYLWDKFDEIEIIVPTYAMSAGTMISLAADRIVMGRQSQLGPIDPQMQVSGRFVSAGAVVDQFREAEKKILEDVRNAHIWAPILQSLGPALLQEARNAIDYGQQIVERWLAQKMFRDRDKPEQLAKKVATHFGATATHKSHGRRIDRDEAADQGLAIESLEKDQLLQEHVLTAYHLVTISFEKGPATKLFSANTGRSWIKNFQISKAR